MRFVIKKNLLVVAVLLIVSKYAAHAQGGGLMTCKADQPGRLRSRQSGAIDKETTTRLKNSKAMTWERVFESNALSRMRLLFFVKPRWIS